ncbi:SAV_6107 family HEPN domain-containing protein [Cellulomonas sp. URHB0016]
MARQIHRQGPGATLGTGPGTAPGSDRVAELLRRADGELLAAQFSPEAWEQFSHAHLAALRAGAAVVAAQGRPGSRRAPRSVWELLDVVAPELARWSASFAAAATLRSAVDAGRFDVISPERAEQAVCDAEDFVDAARAMLQLGSATGGWAPGRVAADAS